jgi:carbon-monoxide dehydrogenase medium subunit
MTRDSKVEFDPLVSEAAPMVKETMPHVAHPQIRNRGTFGGLHAHADPTAQIPAVTWALGAKMLVRSKDGERWVNASDFYAGPFTPAIEANELLVEVALPPMPAHSGSSFKQVARQHGAQGLVGAAAFVILDESGRCSDARLVLTSVGETVLLAASASQLLLGEAPTQELITAAAEAAATVDIDPGSDIHCTAEFRRHLTRVLSRQALTQAFERAAGKGG